MCILHRPALPLQGPHTYRTRVDKYTYLTTQALPTHQHRTHHGVVMGHVCCGTFFVGHFGDGCWISCQKHVGAACVDACLHIRICVYRFMYMYLHMWVCSYLCIGIHIDLYIYIYIYMYMYMYMYPYVCMYVYNLLNFHYQF
eukprot:NODE_2625_length_764_cov_171.661538_g1837_i0.p1 GENE.NODE_2625_length_764_cov_171.661538_g1837_i0~~NODE_2625_length_764_cov_171.661538_g1837_i0.p1  ORF type:complete len:142 (+),score=18.63 NODE_2625_length_764_cov_171.661538_g1837_i0:138-563(+)